MGSNHTMTRRNALSLSLSGALGIGLAARPVAGHAETKPITPRSSTTTMSGNGSPVMLSSMWQIPAGKNPEAVDDEYLKDHLSLIHRIPKLRRHVVLKALASMDSEMPGWYRGEDLWFDTEYDLRAAVMSSEWISVTQSNFMKYSISGLQQDAFRIDEEYLSTSSLPTNAVGLLMLKGTWHIPDGQDPAPIDMQYFKVHLPGVRRNAISRHVVLKAIKWPAEVPTRCWRGAQVWFPSSQTNTAPTLRRKALGDDGFVPLVSGLQLDTFCVEAEHIFASAL